MSISKSITVTADVDGDYSLSEFLELLGDKKALKKALAELEGASKQARIDVSNADKAVKLAAKKAQKERDEMAAELALVKRQSEAVAETVGAAHEKQKALDVRETALSARKSDADARERELNETKASLDAREDELDRRDKALEAARENANAVKSEYEEKLEHLKQVID